MSSGTYLPQVQGLRALAVLMVVSYHIWFGRISGGVDVFLLISAFLLTGQFTRKLEGGRPLALLGYWVRLFRRMLPLISLTLLLTLLGMLLFLPQTRWGPLFGQFWASLGFVQNWFLAAEAVDYYAGDHGLASPLQHFWSLSIQGQVFLLWPLVFALAWLLCRRGRWRARPVLVVLFGTIFAASLSYSIVTTATQQQFAYFDTGARLWEFALGSLLALALPVLRLPRGWRIVLGWLGLCGMLSCGILVQVGQHFPGSLALWPTLSAAAIILAGATGSRWGVDHWLSRRPLVRLGDSSFALYLLHWPVLVLFLAATGREQAGLGPGLLIVAGSLLGAWAATRWVDTPLRRNAWLDATTARSGLALVLCLVIVAAPVAGWQEQLDRAAALATAEAARNSPGAATLMPGFPDLADPGAPLLPSLAAIEDEWPQFPVSCGTGGDAFFNRCSNDQPEGSKHIVVLGSSHAHVFNTPLLEMAQEHHWQLTSMTKGLCPLGQDPAAGISEACAAYNAATLAEVIELAPDLVVTSSTRTDSRPEVPERLDPSWVADVQSLNEAGIKVLALRDTPRTSRSVPQCLEQSPGDYLGCGTVREQLYGVPSPTDAVAAQLPDTSFLDLTALFCPDSYCPAVIGNVIVYKDDNHITRTYMSTLTPFFERAFLTATGWVVDEAEPLG